MGDITLKTKLKTGRPPRHGAFSLMTTGELPRNRKYLRRYLTAVREGLIHDLGPTEEDLPTGKRVLINAVVSKLGVIRCIEEHVRQFGIFRAGELDPSLSRFWLAASNSLRLDLLALGIDKRKIDDCLDLGRYLQTKAVEKAEKPPAEETGEAEIAPDNAGKREIPGDSEPEAGSKGESDA